MYANVYIPYVATVEFELDIFADPIVIAVIDTFTLLFVSVGVVNVSPENVEIKNEFVCSATCEFNIEPIEIDTL